MAHIHEGLAVVQRTGLKLYRPYFLALLAEALGQAGQPEAGLTVLAEAVPLVEIYGWFTEGFDTDDLQEAEALLAEL